MSAPETFVPFMASGPATAGTVAQTLQGALDILGPGNWIQGELRGPGPSFCMVGSLEAAAPNYESYAAARDLLKTDPVISGGLDRWNDASDRTFADVRGALERALAKTLT